MNLQGALNFDGPLVTDPLRERSHFRAVRPARKIVRQVCRENANRLRDEAKADREAGRETKEQRVLRCLAAFFNRYAYWPTPAELTRRMFETAEIVQNRVNLVAPRLSELVNGKVKRSADGSKIRVGGGICEQRPLRTCKVNGDDAHPVAICEVGGR